MGRDLYYYFYDNDLNKIENRKVTRHMRDDILGNIELLKEELTVQYRIKCEDDWNEKELYSLTDIENVINKTSQKYSGFQLLSFEMYNDDDDVLVELTYLSQLLKGALKYNKYGDYDNKEEIIEVAYISFKYY